MCLGLDDVSWKRLGRARESRTTHRTRGLPSVHSHEFGGGGGGGPLIMIQYVRDEIGRKPVLRWWFGHYRVCINTACVRGYGGYTCDQLLAVGQWTRTAARSTARCLLRRRRRLAESRCFFFFFFVSLFLLDEVFFHLLFFFLFSILFIRRPFAFPLVARTHSRSSCSAETAGRGFSRAERMRAAPYVGISLRVYCPCPRARNEDETDLHCARTYTTVRLHCRD